MPHRNHASILIIALAFLCLSASALDCPPRSEIVYSPFTPWWYFYNGTAQRCWRTASCVFIQAGEDESRKQQFSATALVMGLIPLTLRAIAWPAKGVVPVSERPTLVVEVLVLALGLQPRVVAPARAGKDGRGGVVDAREAVERSSLSSASAFARWAWKLSWRGAALRAAVTGVLLLAAYAGVALVEIYSKRSSLGCPFPLTCLMWYVCAVVPAAIHASLSRLRERWTRDWEQQQQQQRQSYGRVASNETSYDHERAALQVSDDKEPNVSKSKDEEPEEWWPVQLAWAIYSIAGTLVFTSIMAVTVIELFVWVMVCLAATGASKLLGYFICLTLEKRR